MSVRLLLLIVILISKTVVLVYCPTAAATWTSVPKICSGQFKAVINTNPKNAAYSGSVTATFSSACTPFTSAPIVVLSLQGFYQNAPATLSTEIGFLIGPGTHTATQLVTTLSIVGAQVALLYYSYFAYASTLPYHQSSFSTQIFSAGDGITSKAAAVRTFTKTVSLSAGETYLNYATRNIKVIGFPTGFTYRQGANGLKFAVTTSLVDANNWKYTVVPSGEVQMTRYCMYRLIIDVQKLMQTYTTIYDEWDIIGVNSSPLPVTISMSDYTTQFMYRSYAIGAVQIDLPPGATNFLFVIATSPIFTALNYNRIVGKAIHERIRTCGASTPFYLHNQQVCYDVCPNFYYTNNTYSFCVPCHYSCKQCTSPGVNAVCSSCDPTTFRTLKSDNTCQCNIGYYQVNAQVCSRCHSSCATCSAGLSTNCLTCDSALNRVYVSSANTCSCIGGYYEANSICNLCPSGCSQCSLNSGTIPSLPNSAVICTACQVVPNLSLDSTIARCLCLAGKYFDTSAIQCSSCHYSCETCTLNTATTCLSCLAANIRTFDSANGICKCNDGYYNSNTAVCSPCAVQCLTCTNIASECASCLTHRVLDTGTKQCNCLIGSPIPNSNLCSGLCGNGILSPDQQCDDGNTIDFDGCSSKCKIQPSHKCQQIGGISKPSLCYFKQPISMNVVTITKDPFQNALQFNLLIKVDPTCNILYLKEYLEQGTSVRFSTASGRLLQTTPSDPSKLTVQKAQFNTNTNILYLYASYLSSVVLSDQHVLFSASGSTTAPDDKYFYDTPSTFIQLPFQTSNKIITTFYDPSSYSNSRISGFVYLAVLILCWVFYVYTVWRHVAMIGSLFLLVNASIAIGLVSRSKIQMGYAGVVLFGKYSFGYNDINFHRPQTYTALQCSSSNVACRCSYLSEISLSCDPISNLNITFWIVIVSCITLLTLMFIREYSRHSQNLNPTNSTGKNNTTASNYMSTNSENPPIPAILALAAKQNNTMNLSILTSSRDDIKQPETTKDKILFHLSQISLSLLFIMLPLLSMSLSSVQSTDNLGLASVIVYLLITLAILSIWLYKYPKTFNNYSSFSRLFRRRLSVLSQRIIYGIAIGILLLWPAIAVRLQPRGLILAPLMIVGSTILTIACYNRKIFCLKPITLIIIMNSIIVSLLQITFMLGEFIETSGLIGAYASSALVMVGMIVNIVGVEKYRKDKLLEITLTQSIYQQQPSDDPKLTAMQRTPMSMMMTPINRQRLPELITGPYNSNLSIQLGSASNQKNGTIIESTDASPNKPSLASLNSYLVNNSLLYNKNNLTPTKESLNAIRSRLRPTIPQINSPNNAPSYTSININIMNPNNQSRLNIRSQVNDIYGINQEQLADL